MAEDLVEVELNIEDDLLLVLALEAHRRDMKLNDYILEIVMEYCDTVEKENSS